MESKLYGAGVGAEGHVGGGLNILSGLGQCGEREGKRSDSRFFFIVKLMRIAVKLDVRVRKRVRGHSEDLSLSNGVDCGAINLAGQPWEM